VAAPQANRGDGESHTRGTAHQARRCARLSQCGMASDRYRGGAQGTSPHAEAQRCFLRVDSDWKNLLPSKAARTTILHCKILRLRDNHIPGGFSLPCPVRPYLPPQTFPVYRGGPCRVRGRSPRNAVQELRILAPPLAGYAGRLRDPRPGPLRHGAPLLSSNRRRMR
jgi:hypothetical protein